MDIQSLKIELAQKILNSTKPALLEKVDQLFKMEEPTDWWEDLPSEIQDSIYQGIKDVEDRKVLIHEQVVQEAKENFGF